MASGSVAAGSRSENGRLSVKPAVKRTDAASVLFTAGFTDRIPGSLADPAATLPLAIFFQLGTPFPEVQQRAYASAAVLTLIILLISLAGRAMSRKVTRHVVK